MSDKIICTECNHKHSINDMQLWEVYEHEGKVTKLDCDNCGKPLVITSIVTGWEFEVELND